MGGSTVKNPPALQEMQIQSLGWEDPLEKEMATHSTILAWEIPWTEEPGGLQSMGLQRAGHDWATKQEQQTFMKSMNHSLPWNPWNVFHHSLYWMKYVKHRYIIYMCVCVCVCVYVPYEGTKSSLVNDWTHFLAVFFLFMFQWSERVPINIWHFTKGEKW